jgi:hypothetical protein
MAELVHQSLRALCLLHDALFVVLSDGPRELVVVHGWTVLAPTPQKGHTDRVFNLEDALWPIEPTDAGAVQLRLTQQFLQELPQVNV